MIQSQAPRLYLVEKKDKRASITSYDADADNGVGEQEPDAPPL